MNYIIAIVAFSFLGGILGLILSVSGKFFAVKNESLEQIENLLPGINCGACGFPGCKGAAQALYERKVSSNICPPGGIDLANKLSKKLGIEYSHKETKTIFATIKDELCIGCCKCSKVCPTDVIIGSAKNIHAVFSEGCIGCSMCVDVCPTNAISMKEEIVTLSTWKTPKPELTSP